MNASIDEIAVIRARLPYIDRRALSEAWFSALHLAGDAAFSEATRERKLSETASHAASSPLRSVEHASGNGRAVVPHPSSTAMQRIGGKIVPLETRANIATTRRLPLSPTVAAPPRVHEVHASLTLTIANARVALHVRSDGNKMSAIVICSARHIELVRRALAATVLALELRGTRVEAEVRALEQERA